MKKFISLMACSTLALCGGALLTACGDKKDNKKTPQANFVVEADLKNDVKGVMEELNTEVYNLAPDENKTYTYNTYGETKGLVELMTGLDKGYYVEVGKVENASVTSITVGGQTYASDQKVKLSIGENNFIEEKAFYVDADNKLFVIAPIVALELKNANPFIVVNDMQKDLFTNTAAEQMTFDQVAFENVDGITPDGETTNVATKKSTGTNDYDLKINSADDALILKPATGTTLDSEKGRFLTRTVIDDENPYFGITGVDEGGLGMFFGRKQDGTLDTSIDGQNRVFDLYYTETGANTTEKRQQAKFTFDIDVNDFVVANDIVNNVKEAVESLNTNVYNKDALKDTNNGTTPHDMTFQEVKTKLTSANLKDYYVNVGSYVEDVESIELNGVKYEKDEDFRLSIGLNNHIVDKAFVYGADGSLKIAAPIVAFEAHNARKIKINDKEYDFIPATQTVVDELTFSGYQFGNGETSSSTGNKAEKVTTSGQETATKNEVNVTLKKSNEMLVAKLNGTDNTNGHFLTRSVEADGTLSGYSITGLDNGGYGVYFGYKEDGTTDVKWHNRKLTVDLYYSNGTGNAKSTQVTFNVRVVKDEDALQNLINTATAENGSKEVVLPCDFEVTKQLTQIKSELKINLNGNNITANKTSVQDSDGATKENNPYIFVVGENGKLTIEGEGKITSNAIIFTVWNTPAAAATSETEAQPNLVIKGGTFETSAPDVVYVYQGKARIEGGSFKSTNSEGDGNHKFTLNCFDTHANGTNGDKKASIEVVGGTFYDFNPSSLQNGDGNSYLPQNYTASQNGTGDDAKWYTVTANGGAQA